jgi:hypothetical protein
MCMPDGEPSAAIRIPGVTPKRVIVRISAATQGASSSRV